MEYIFGKNINGSEADGIVKIDSMELICLCTEHNSKLLLKALNMSGVSKRSELFKIRCTNCGIDEIITDKHCNCCGAKQPSYFK